MMTTKQKEIEDLKSKLEKEKKINKNFASHMIRLNTLLKRRQDALIAEQEMVRKLKAQLEESQVLNASALSSTEGKITKNLFLESSILSLSAKMGQADHHHTSLGVTGEVSTVVEWRIPNFFSFEADTVEYLESPSFLLAGCEWCLELYPKGIEKNGWVTASLRKVDCKTADKRIKVEFGIWKKDGHVTETLAVEHIYPEDSAVLVDFIKICFLRRESFELEPFHTLAVRCRLEAESVTPEAVSSKVSKVKPRQQLVELETLSSDLEDLLVSERKCDVTIQVEDKEFRAHKAILCARSPVFRAMFDHDTSEDRTGVLPIADCNPDSFGVFLSYIYTGRIEQESFRTAYHLYTTADKYDVQQLKSFCSEYLKQNLTAENVCDVVVLADQHSDDELISSAHVFFNQNFRSILTTPEWTTMIKKYPRLSDKLLKVMASTV